MLKCHIINWSHTASEYGTQKLCDNITGRLESLSSTGITTSFLNDHTMVLDNHVKSKKYFDHLKFYAFDNLIPGQLNAHELLNESLDFHANKAFCNQM